MAKKNTSHQLQKEYRHVQSIAKIGHWVWDIQKDHLVWSDEIYNIFDITPTAFKNTYTSFLERIHPEDLQSVTDAVDNALEYDAVYDIEHRIILSSQNMRTVQERATILRDDGGRPLQMLGTVQDVTDMCALTQELQLFKSRLDYLQQHSPILLISGSITDALRIDYYSINLPEIFGFSHMEVLDKDFDFAHLVHPGEKNRLAAMINEFQRHKKADGYMRLRHKNGAYLYCHIILKADHGSSDHYIGYVENMNESFIARSEADLMKSLINDINDAIFVIDPASGDILDTNTNACKALGYTRAELRRLNIFDIEQQFNSPEEWQAHVEELSKQRRMLVEGVHVCKDRSTIPVEVNVTYIETDHAYIAAVARDITKRREIEAELLTYQTELEKQIAHRTKELEQSNNKLQSYIDIVDNNILTTSTDMNGTITYVSDAMCQKTGYLQEELLGKTHRLFKHPETDEHMYKELWETITSGKTWEGEMRLLCKDGTTLWTHTVIQPLYDSERNISGYTAVRHDITYQKKVESLAITDPLTGLFNRRHFYERFPLELRRAKRHQLCLNFLMLDIDFFKQYNDTYGHQKGDQVLIKVGDLVKTSLKRAEDSAFRLGGEEFGIIYISDDFDSARGFAKSLLKKIRHKSIPHKSSSSAKHVTASMGLVSTYVQTIPEWEVLYEMADKALYHVKESGRNGLFVTTFI